MKVKYTWYVNSMGDVQIYKGDINENYILDYLTIENAELHSKSVERFIFEFNLKDDVLKEKYIPCKYYIPSDFADMFFTTIGSPTYYHGASGCTDVELSDFLD